MEADIRELAAALAKEQNKRVDLEFQLNAAKCQLEEAQARKANYKAIIARLEACIP